MHVHHLVHAACFFRSSSRAKVADAPSVEGEPSDEKRKGETEQTTKRNADTDNN